MDVMPFLFGAMAFKNGERFFNDLLEICKKLPFRFHQWYGDQYSLKLYYEKTKFKFSKLDINKYLYITKSEIDVFEIMKLMENDVRVITFKGKGTNRYILSTIKNILELNLNRINSLCIKKSIWIMKKTKKYRKSLDKKNFF